MLRPEPALCLALAASAHFPKQAAGPTHYPHSVVGRVLSEVEISANAAFPFSV